MGNEAREVARLLRMGPNTERKYREALTLEGLLAGSADSIPDFGTLKAAVEKHHPPKAAPQETSSIEEWEPHVTTFLDDGLGPRAIYDRLRQEHASDFKGSYWAVKRLCKRLARAGGVRPEDIAIRVETALGEVAQVDFGEIDRLFDPKTRVLRRAWVFVMVLAHSRHMFAKVVFDQKAETWIRLHIEAFESFGRRVPRILVPDNLKSAVVRAAFGLGDSPVLNRSYRELARYYGFKIDPTPPYAPEKKGKVESAVKYLKKNALAGREGEDIDDVNRALAAWVRQIAGTRIHGTTQRKPLEVFESEEHAQMMPTPKAPFEPIIWKSATVHGDGHVSFERRFYSVPWNVVGDVWIRATSTTVEIYANDDRIATHSRHGKGVWSTQESHLPEHRRDLRHRSSAYWIERAQAISEEVGALAKEVFESDDVIYQLRSVQAIVTYLEKFPTSRATAAAKRARFYSNYTYQGIKRILTQALDLEPLPTAVIEKPEQPGQFRFARNISELMSSRTEDAHEPN
jgi:transposase